MLYSDYSKILEDKFELLKYTRIPGNLKIEETFIGRSYSLFVKPVITIATSKVIKTEYVIEMQVGYDIASNIMSDTAIDDFITLLDSLVSLDDFGGIEDQPKSDRHPIDTYKLIITFSFYFGGGSC